MKETWKNFDETMSLVEEFLDDDLEKSKVGTQQLKEAMTTLVAFKSDLYPELRNAISLVLKWAVGDKIKKSRKPDRSSITDAWPSVPIAAPAHVCEKMIDRMEGRKDDEGAKES